MGNTVYFYAVNAGALATMLPLVDDCPAGMHCVWVAEGYATRMLSGKMTKPINVEELLNRLDSRPGFNDVLMLGPQHNHKKTVEMLHQCEMLGIKTGFITDHWSNNHLHFTSDDGSLIFPTRVFAIDDYVRSELLSIGMDESQIAVIGHPGLENKINSISKMSSRDINHIRDTLKLIPSCKVIILVLELMSQDFDAEKEFGLILDVANALYSNDNQQTQLVVKAHPSQGYDRLIKYIEAQNLTRKITVCPEAMGDVDAMAISDLVIGVNSAMLMLPLILGIPVISLRCNQMARIESKCTIPYLREFIVNNSNELSSVIIETFNHAFNKKVLFPTDSVNKAWDEIRMLQRML